MRYDDMYEEGRKRAFRTEHRQIYGRCAKISPCISTNIVQSRSTGQTLQHYEHNIYTEHINSCILFVLYIWNVCLTAQDRAISVEIYGPILYNYQPGENPRRNKHCRIETFVGSAERSSSGERRIVWGAGLDILRNAVNQNFFPKFCHPDIFHQL